MFRDILRSSKTLINDDLSYLQEIASLRSSITSKEVQMSRYTDDIDEAKQKFTQVDGEIQVRWLL